MRQGFDPLPFLSFSFNLHHYLSNCTKRSKKGRPLMCQDVNHGLKCDKMKPKKFEIPTFIMRKFETPDESGDSMTEKPAV